MFTWTTFVASIGRLVGRVLVLRNQASQVGDIHEKRLIILPPSCSARCFRLRYWQEVLIGQWLA